MMARSALLIHSLLFSLLAAIASAQMGTNITTPAYNATVAPGDHITIEYYYGNLGTGNYTVDIALWQDASASQLIQNITTDRAVENGNSTGFQLNYTYSATYDWTVPGDLTITTKNDNGDDVRSAPELIYLTVTTLANTKYMGAISARSRPIMLHYNAGTVITPSVAFILIAVASVLLCGF